MPEVTPETAIEDVAKMIGTVPQAAETSKDVQPAVPASPAALAKDTPSGAQKRLSQQLLGSTIPGTPGALSMAKEKLRGALSVAIERPASTLAAPGVQSATIEKPAAKAVAPGALSVAIEKPRGSSTVADAASREAGGRVFMVSSLDDAHPADNVIDGNEQTYWLSTGLYPQEIILELGRPSRVAGVQLSATNVRTVRVEGCSEQPAVSFEPLATGELEAGAGLLQRQELRCIKQALPTLFLRAKILSGWHDFCSVHRIVVME